MSDGKPVLELLDSHHAGDGFEEGGGVVADAVFKDGFGFAKVGDDFVGVAVYDDEVGCFTDFNTAGLFGDTEELSTCLLYTSDAADE